MLNKKQTTNIKKDQKYVVPKVEKAKMDFNLFSKNNGWIIDDYAALLAQCYGSPCG